MVWNYLWSQLNEHGKISRKTVRKVAHMSAAPVMMISWALYPRPFTVATRIIASFVPFLFAVRLYLSRPNDFICTSSSRSGHAKESRGGPFAYCVTMTVTIIFIGPHNVVTYAIIGGLMGDGMAEIVGNTIPSLQWPLPKGWKRKSLAGSLALTATCLICTSLFLKFAQLTALCNETLSLEKLLTISLLCSIAEILPFEDNYSVPLAATLAFT